jgi:hypothetical protein
MFTAYQDNVDRILASETYQAEFPTGLNKNMMMRRTINGHDVLDILPSTVVGLHVPG